MMTSQPDRTPIPLRYPIINLLCNYLESKCVAVEGLLRVSGRGGGVAQVWQGLAQEEEAKAKGLPQPQPHSQSAQSAQSQLLPLDDDPDAPHTVASTLKLYLRDQLDDPLIPFDLYEPLIRSQKEADPHQAVLQIIGSLPPVKYIMLQRVIHLLVKIAEKSSINKMTEDNLAIVMGPTLIRPRPGEGPQDELADMTVSTGVVLDMLHHYYDFFPGAEASPAVVQVRPVTVTPFVGKRRRTVNTQALSQRPLRPRDFDMRPFINKKLVTQVSPANFEPVEDILLVQRVEYNDVLTWTPHAQTPFILSPYYIVLTPRFFHFMDANTYRVKGTLLIKQVQLMSVDTLHKGLFSITDGDPSRGTTWMFLSYTDKMIHHIVDIIRKNQALTITGRKSVFLFSPKRCPILLEGGESEESQRAMAMMLQTLHKAGYNEQDILDGSADLYEIVKRYKGGPKYVIEFLYPPSNPDFMGIYRKSYKLDRRTPVATILRLLCAKARPGGVDTQQYVLCTLRGRTLLETENLASYGLGALFTTWQLRVMHKSHALVISGTVVDFTLPATPEFKGTTRKTVKVEPTHEVRHAILALFRHLRFPLEPHRYEAVTEDGKVLRDNAPLSEYGLGLKFMTMRVSVVPRKFPTISQDKEKNKAMTKTILEELVNSIVTTKVTEKQRAKEQYCRDMLLYVFNKATYEISRASFLPLRVETLGRVHREKIYDLLVKLENTELQRLNLYGYHHFVKRARVVAGQSNQVQLPYMTAAEIQAHEVAEKEAEKRTKMLNQRQQHQQQAMAFAPPPPPPSPAAPPPPPLMGKGGKIPAKKISIPPPEAAPEVKKSQPSTALSPMIAGGMNLMSSALFKKKAEEKAAQKSPAPERRATSPSGPNAPSSPSSRRVTVTSPPPNFAKPMQSSTPSSVPSTPTLESSPSGSLLSSSESTTQNAALVAPTPSLDPTSPQPTPETSVPPGDITSPTS